MAGKTIFQRTPLELNAYMAAALEPMTSARDDCVALGLTGQSRVGMSLCFEKVVELFAGRLVETVVKDHLATKEDFEEIDFSVIPPLGHHWFLGLGEAGGLATNSAAHIQIIRD